MESNLEREERHPAEGEDGNDYDEHAHNAFPLVESLDLGRGVRESSGRRDLPGRCVEPQGMSDTSVRHQHRQQLQTRHDTLRFSPRCRTHASALVLWLIADLNFVKSSLDR